MKRMRLGVCLSMLVLGLFYALHPLATRAQAADAGAMVYGDFTGVTVDNTGWVTGASVSVSAGGTDPGNHFTFAGAAAGQAGLGFLRLSTTYNYAVTFDPYNAAKPDQYPKGTFQEIAGSSGGWAYFNDWMTVTGPQPGDPISVNLQFNVEGKEQATAGMEMSGILSFEIDEGGLVYNENGDPVPYLDLWVLSGPQGPVSVKVHNAHVGDDVRFVLGITLSVGTCHLDNQTCGVGPYTGTGSLDFLGTVELDKVVVTDPQDVVLAEFDGSGNLLPGYESSGYGLGQITPEPATLSLMALGALATLRRRRKM